MSDEKRIYISKSRIEQYEKCSWAYWCKYHLKIPDHKHQRTMIGTVVHSILENMIHPKRKKIVSSIRKKKDIYSFKPMRRFVNNLARHNDLEFIEWDLINNLVLTAFSLDFYGGKGGKPRDPEEKFQLHNEDPRYNILGFIDLPIDYTKKVVIRDYKCGKNKPNEEEQSWNIQSIIYDLALKKQGETRKIESEFQYLDHPEDPIVKGTELSEEEMEGFEYVLADYQEKFEKFDESHAYKNFAADSEPRKGKFEGKLCCGFARFSGQKKKDGNPMYHCAFKFAFEYWVLYNKEGEIIKTQKEPFDNIGDQCYQKKHKYSGCPKFNN